MRTVNVSKINVLYESNFTRSITDLEFSTQTSLVELIHIYELISVKLAL